MGTRKEELINYDDHIRDILQDDKFVIEYIAEALREKDKKIITLVCENIIKARGE